MLLKSAILAKCYHAVVPHLKHSVYNIENTLTNVESKDVRLFYYYGGIIFLSQKEFRNAVEFFRNVISSPALVTSVIMIEAYKKYVLASLIINSTTTQVPRYASNGLIRHVRSLCSPYEEFATSYRTNSLEDLSKCLENHSEEFVKDGNFGLAKQVLESLARENIARLTKTYLTLSIEDIATQAGLLDGHLIERVLSMIQKGQVFAKINELDGMISFHESTEKYNSTTTLQYLDKQIHETIGLYEQLTTIDNEIAFSNEYIHKILRSDRGGSRSWSGMDEDDYNSSLAMSMSGM
eukprot:TRINITY_DN6693_c0_g1_i1.p1 TRINITY_DN6693_c0_g1~~TRINITY_DN6693_c0_g1_i1.p1  ORF type:complete len:294 (+),score=48.26 TRINITY_DN6693_c0_g1_i1:466-1347(+)